jgi:hypothetical protein
MQTPTYKLLKAIWESGNKDSWCRINNSIQQAVLLAIGSGLEFDRSDIVAIYDEFRGHHWMSESSEWVYSMAIAVGNDSCVEAYEAYKGRTPFRANDVDLGYQQTHGYIHNHNPNRARRRVAVGFTFMLDGHEWIVTSFDDSKGLIRFARYEGKDRKPKELRKATNEEFAALFPAPKKLKTA